MTDLQSKPQLEPKVLTWFRVYLGISCLFYIYWAARSLALAMFPGYYSTLAGHRPMPDDSPMEGWIMLIVFVILLLGTALPLILKPTSWVWLYDLVIICLGMMLACFLPVCIPLLIFWIKPETKRYFGRSDA
jgi:hypothetical protein